jgi:eukaryotic-like serine/threonine-protein kinase
MSNTPVDRNLLFGILALQMDFITREALIAAMNAWVLEKSKPLGQILVERGELDADAHELVSRMIGKHLELHNNDPRQSLLALGARDALGEHLTQIADRDLQASLVRIATVPPAAPSQDTTLPPPSHEGANSDRFVILRPHARGGLGEVFLARDRELNREVALKRIHERLAGNADSRMRFLLEAEITGGLEHPGVVPVYGLGTAADGRPYYAMRFVRGQTLKDAIEKFHSAVGGPERDRRLGLRQLLNRFIAVCNAIEYAHNCGVIHRDLKPSNIMLGNYGETVVVDWGLAKAMGRRGEFASPEEHTLVPSSGTSSSETLPGSAIGTPAFMSPEQSEGRLDDIGPASDIYSLGATLYVLLTGKEPFQSSIVGVILGKVQTGDFVSPRALDRTVPAPLNAICLKAMSLRPADRYPSCAALASDLEHWLADEPVSAFQDPRSVRVARWIKRHRAVAASSAALLITAFVGLIIGTALLGRANSRIAAEAAERMRQQGLAEEGRNQAIEQRTLAEDRELTARRYLYHAQINLAQQALDSGRVGHVIQLLDGQRPLAGQRDLRGFGWYYLYKLSHSERATLPGFRGSIASVRIAPDGKTLAIASGAVIELWDTSPLRPRTLLRGGSVDGIAFSPDGTILASGGEDSRIQLWSVREAKLFATLTGHTNQVFEVSFSPDGKILASGSFDGTVKLWNVPPRGSKSVAAPSSPAASAIGGVFSLFGAGQGSENRASNPYLRVSLVPPRTAESGNNPPRGLWSSRRVVYGVAFSPDGKLVASAGADKIVRLWDVATAKQRRALIGHRDTITPVAFSPDGKLVASGSDDTTVRLWDPVTGKQWLPPLSGHKDWVQALTFSPDGRFLASGSRDNCVKVWSLSTPSETTGNTHALSTGKTSTGDAESQTTGEQDKDSGQIATEWTSFKGHTAQVSTLAFTRDGKKLFSGADDGLVKFWDVLKGQENVTLHGHTGRLYAVAFSPDGTLLASASDDATVRLWDVATRRTRALLGGHKSRVATVAFSADGKRLATAGWDHVVKLWDVASTRETGMTLPMGGYVYCVGFSPKGELLAAGDTTGAIKLWDVTTGKPSATLLGHTSEVDSLAFSPNGTLLASASADSSVRLWDVASHHHLIALAGYTGRGSVVAFSADGQILAAGAADHTVRLWDVATRQERSPLRGHTAMVQGVAFSHDGKLLASSSDDTTVKIWDVSTGEELLTLTGHSTVIPSVAFSPDDSTVASASFDQTIKLWNVKPASKEEVRADDDARRVREGQGIGSSQGEEAMRGNNEAWLLATNPDPKLRDIHAALKLALQAVQAKPSDGTFWNTLGVAYYRSGEWNKAIKSLEKGMALRAGGDASDWFFLAMANWQLGDKADARKQYDRAVVWMKQFRPADEELLRFRAEAEELLGLKVTPAPNRPVEGAKGK